jgi:putative membrane protein
MNTSTLRQAAGISLALLLSVAGYSQAGTPSASSSTTSSKSISHSDKSFLEKATKAGMKEVAVTQAVLSRLSTPSVRDLAQTVISDHTAANAELMSLAQAKGVTLPTSEDDKIDKVTKKWAGKTDDLEEDYLKEMVSDHKDAVDLYEKAAKSDDPDIAAFAQKTLPTLLHHLEMAKMQKKMEK